MSWGDTRRYTWADVAKAGENGPTPEDLAQDDKDQAYFLKMQRLNMVPINSPFEQGIVSDRDLFPWLA